MPNNQQPQTDQPLLAAPIEASKPLRVLYSALDNYGGYPFADLFDTVVGVYNPDDMKIQNSCLVLWGGGDISPGIYGQHPSSRTGALDTPSSKDQLELNLAGRAIKMGLPIIGVCRGAQMMCALAGGKLVQDVSGHSHDHFIETDEGKVLTATSLHHQMMYPWDVSHRLIAWCSPPRSSSYLEGNALTEKVLKDVVSSFPADLDVEKREPEIVYFPTIKSLCIQGHPEFINNEKHQFVRYCQQLVEHYLIEPFLK